MVSSYFRPRIFIAHADEQTSLARSLNEKLRARGAKVFFDKEQDSLPAGDDFDTRIRRAIAASDVFVFLVSAESVTPGKYTLTELEYARKRWPNPAGHVLPVSVRPERGGASVQLALVPPYLKEVVTILQPHGNFATETAEVAIALGRSAQVRRVLFAVGGAAAGAVVCYSSVLLARTESPAPTPTPHLSLSPPPPPTSGTRRIAATPEVGIRVAIDGRPSQACDGECAWLVRAAEEHVLTTDVDVCYQGCNKSSESALRYRTCVIPPGTAESTVSIQHRPKKQVPGSCRFDGGLPGAASDREECECICNGKSKTAQGLKGGRECKALRDDCCKGGRCSSRSVALDCSSTPP
jgi:hypothetical protein